MVKAFYQSARYEPLREAWVRRTPIGPDITFSDTYPIERDRILNYFDQMSVERVGILHGEYLLIQTGLLLADRNLVLTAACVSLDDRHIAELLSKYVAEPSLTTYLQEQLDHWDRLPLAVSPPLLCDPYALNYFHFSLEMIPRVRHFASVRDRALLIARECVARPFQLDLLRRSFSGLSYHLLTGPIRVRDPIVAHDTMSEEGVHWLRRESRISVPSGKRRLYIRRGVSGTRSSSGGGISESKGFLALLRDFGFEAIDSSGGELGVAAQVQLLDGARLILAVHGAALTNLAYLNPELTVIEVMGPKTAWSCFMHLSAMLGFRYHGILSQTYDDDGDIIIDLDELHGVMRVLT
jgi:hypothetical protein